MSYPICQVRMCGGSGTRSTLISPVGERRVLASRWWYIKAQQVASQTGLDVHRHRTVRVIHQIIIPITGRTGVRVLFSCSLSVSYWDVVRVANLPTSLGGRHRRQGVEDVTTVLIEIMTSTALFSPLNLGDAVSNLVLKNNFLFLNNSGMFDSFEFYCNFARQCLSWTTA